MAGQSRRIIYSSSSMELVDVFKSPTLSVTKVLWKNLAPPKVKFCGWLAWRGRLKTAAVLKNLAVLNEESVALRLFCKSEEESVHHLLLFCPFAWKVWTDMMQWWGLVWVLPGSVEDLLLWWSGVKFNQIVLRMWRVVPFDCYVVFMES